MNKLLLLCGALCFPVASALAGGYTPLTCQGQMPDQVQHLLGSTKLNETETDIKSLMRSGNVLYGTPLNLYVDSIAAILNKANPQPNHDKIHIYLYKSNEANAFICKDGTLFMNVGMLAQASSEAELAMVLAHEFSHFDKHHTVTVSKKELRKAKNAMEYALKKRQQSRDNETEADSYAITGYYKNTNYSYEAVQGLFDLLQYSYLPFDEVAFNRSFVETSDYKFPDEYYLTKLKPISSREDYVDTLSTHPNLQKRRQNADDLVRSLNDDGRSEFAIGEASFDRMRALARKEAISIMLNNHDFAEAFYNTYVLMSETPEDPELKTFAAQALYGLAKYSEAGELNDIVPDYKKTEGESGAAYHFLRKLKKKELALLALRFAWNAQQVNPEVEPLTKSLMTLVRDYNLDASKFSDFAMGTSVEDAQKQIDAKMKASAPKKEVKTAPVAAVKETTKTTTKSSSKNKRRRNIPDAKQTATTATTETATTTEGKSRSSKYDNIKQKQVRENYVLPDSSFTTLNYMLVDLKTDTAFVALFEKSAKSDEQKEVKSALDSYTKTSGTYDGGKILLMTFSFGDSKTLAKKDKDLQDNIMRWGAKNDIHFVCYEQQLQNNPNTRNYNIYTYLKNMQIQSIATSGKHMAFISNPVIDSLLAKDGVTKMLDVRVSDRLDDSFCMHGWYGGLLVPVALPVIVSTGFINQRSLAASASLTDVKSGESEYSEAMQADGYNTQAKMQAFFYHFISNIKKGNK